MLSSAPPGPSRPIVNATPTERRLLGLIHRAGEITQADITRAMEVGQPAVSRLVASLAHQGLLRLGPSAPRGRGQPSATLSLVPDFAFGMGVSLLGDSVAVSLVDFSGRPRWAGVRAMPVMARDPVAVALKEMKADMLAESGISPDRIAGAGAGVSAFFVGEGELMNPPSLLDDWALVEIAPLLSGILELPVRVDNDGNVACMGEGLLGVGRRHRSFAYFQITNGFGGGIVIDGSPCRGAFGNAGEFAAVWQAMGIEHPNLERLRRLMAEHGTRFATVSDMLVDLDVMSSGVDAWLAEAGPAFSVAATAASAVIDCEAVVLGGRIPHSLALRLAGRMTIAGTERRGRPRPLPVILPAEAPGDAVALGAAMLALQPAYFL